MKKFTLLVFALVLSACDLTITTTPQSSPIVIPTPALDTPTIEFSSTTTPSNTITPSQTALFTNTPEIAQNSPFPTFTPTESESPTWIASPSITETASATISPTFSPLPTHTPNPLPITTQAQLQACVNQSGAICRISGTIQVTSQLNITASGVTIIGGEITNAPEYPNRLAMIARTADVRLENVTIYGTIATSKSAIKDCVLILDSTRVVLERVTLAYCEDELLDISNSTAIEVTDSIIAYPLNCAMHSKGCHPFNALCIHCEVTFTRVLFAAGRERLPKCEHGYCSVIDSIYYDIDGYALNAAGESVIVFRGNAVLTGQDTDTPSYVIVAGNADQYPTDPVITENCTLVINPIPHLVTGNLYPRVRRYGGDRPLYTNPTTQTPLLSNTQGCVMPTIADYWTRLEGVGDDSALSEVIRQSVEDGTGVITSVPLG